MCVKNAAMSPVVAIQASSNTGFNANNWINKRTGTDRPKFVFNQAGGNIGGPIRRNKAFFFGNYEAMRRRWGRTARKAP